MPPRLLILSNGHGEDLIALRVIGALHRLLPDLELQVLPLVGEGNSYGKAEAMGMLRQVGPRQSLPSGGFSNQSLGGLVQDLGAGLAGLSWQQAALVRRWGQRQHRDRAGGVAVAQGFDHPQGNQVFAMAVA